MKRILEILDGSGFATIDCKNYADLQTAYGMYSANVAWFDGDPTAANHAKVIYGFHFARPCWQRI